MNRATESKELSPDGSPAPPRRELKLVPRVVVEVDPPVSVSIAKISISDDMFSGSRKQQVRNAGSKQQVRNAGSTGKTPKPLEPEPSETLPNVNGDSRLLSKRLPDLPKTASATVVAALVLGGMLGYIVGRSKPRTPDEA